MEIYSISFVWISKIIKTDLLLQSLTSPPTQTSLINIEAKYVLILRQGA